MDHIQESTAEALPPIVLLVEDDPDTAELFEVALGRGGMWVDKVRLADDTLTYAIELRPDGVVIDSSRPAGGDAIALATELRANPGTADVSIVGVFGIDVAQLGDRAGLFSDVFTKPVPLGRFVDRLKVLSVRGAVLRERSTRVRAHVPDLVAMSDRLIQQAAELVLAVPLRQRSCPRCRAPIVFTERAELAGVVFDYYTPCPAGCGLYCYDHSRRKMMALIE